MRRWRHGDPGPGRPARLQDLAYPTLRAVAPLAARPRRRRSRPACSPTDVGATPDQLALTCGGDRTKTKSVLVDRYDLARSGAKLGGASNAGAGRGLFVLSACGKEVLALPEDEGRARVRVMDREVAPPPQPPQHHAGPVATG